MSRCEQTIVEYNSCEVKINLSSHHARWVITAAAVGYLNQAIYYYELNLQVDYPEDWLRKIAAAAAAGNGLNRPHALIAK